jgi:hypothetical protein
MEFQNFVKTNAELRVDADPHKRRDQTVDSEKFTHVQAR